MDWKYFATPEEVAAAKDALARLESSLRAAELAVGTLNIYAITWNHRMVEAVSEQKQLPQK
jgi:hypothetical protein